MELQKSERYARAYVEILQVINHMGEKYKKKVPIKLLNFFEENKDVNYIYNLDIVEENNAKTLSNETIGLLAMLELKYWATPSEKEVLKKSLIDNEIKYQKKISEKYNKNDIFNQQVKNDENLVVEKNEIRICKDSIFKKIINKIKIFFHIN